MGEPFYPLLDEPLAVTLTARTPHGRTFALVEHSELDSTSVSDDTHLSAQCVYLTHDLPFGYTAYGRIAAHLCNLIHIHCDKKRLATHSGGSAGCFAPCVSGSDHNHIIYKFLIHFLLLPIVCPRCCQRQLPL